MDPVSAAYALVMLASADIHLGDLPTWFAAVGTVGALGAALWQIGSERRRRHQREVFDQARRIAAVVGPDKPPEEEGQEGWRGIDLSNGSDEPVYRLLVAMVAIQGDDPHTIEEIVEYGEHWQQKQGERPLLPIGTTSILPSGTYRLWIYGRFRAGVLDSRYAAEVAFTDRAGAHWIRHATGQLEKLPEDPITHYLGGGPHAVLPLERLL